MKPTHSSISARAARCALACLILLLVLGACSPVAAAQQPASILATATRLVLPTSAPATVETPAASAQPTSAPAQMLYLPEYLPARLRDSIKLPNGWATTGDENQGSLRLDVWTNPSPDPGAVVWVYALAAPFPTVTDEITLADLKTAWSSGPNEQMPFQSLLVDSSTRAVFEKAWGPASAKVITTPAQSLVSAAWDTKNAWAILPFEQLEPRWKVIALDGQSPVRKDFDPAHYGLSVAFAIQGDPTLRASLLDAGALPVGNRLADHLTTVMVTGVTALVRGTASFMEGRGMDYPAQDIGDWLREADILHVSNEVAFAKNCPDPYNWDGLKFCSRPKYIQLLEDVGVDVVELTGDHFSDWGPEAVLYTLDLYKKEGWKYYGGGANLEEARQPALLEHNGNKIAFIGCNAKPPGYALASETTPGAWHCDNDWMAKEVTKLREQGYLPIVTYQHLEYYSYPAHPILQQDFRQMADAGAVIVSGSQAHQPHAFEYRAGSFLHYGLGNLFFDQTNQGEAPRTAFIDRHVFYEGRHISTELLTIYLVDYARSRPMTPKERADLLTAVFKASGW